MHTVEIVKATSASLQESNNPIMFHSAVALSFLFLLSATSVSCFTTTFQQETRSSNLLASLQETEGDSRRDFFSKTAGMAAVGLGCPFLPIDAAEAVSGVGKVNAKLKG